MLFLPAVLEVKRRIEQGDLGKVYMVELSHSFSAGYNTWQFDKSAGGGTLLSSGIYAVQLLQWLFGEIQLIRGVKSAFEDGTEWQYSLTGRLDNDILFTIKNSTRGVLDNTARICGGKGYAELPQYWKARKAAFYIDGKQEVAEYPCEHELIYEAEHIAQCMAEGRITSPVVTEEVTLAGIRALEKVEWI